MAGRRQATVARIGQSFEYDDVQGREKLAATVKRINERAAYVVDKDVTTSLMETKVARLRSNNGATLATCALRQSP
jgi:hypothetical protein